MQRSSEANSTLSGSWSRIDSEWEDTNWRARSGRGGAEGWGRVEGRSSKKRGGTWGRMKRLEGGQSQLLEDNRQVPVQDRLPFAERLLLEVLNHASYRGVLGPVLVRGEAQNRVERTEISLDRSIEAVRFLLWKVHEDQISVSCRRDRLARETQSNFIPCVQEHSRAWNVELRSVNKRAHASLSREPAKSPARSLRTMACKVASCQS